MSEMNQEFQAKAGEFVGPMEILLRLIEERKLHISQVSLAQVADDFLAYLRSLETDCKGEIANFILTASTLMLIKSLALLPTLNVTSEEKESMADLEKRLKLYQQIRQLSAHVKELYGRRIIFARGLSESARTPVFAPTTELTTARLLAVFKTIIANLPRPEKLPQAIVKKIISLEEVILDLTKRVQSALRTSFRQFVASKGGRTEKANIIVSFLGLLELIKRGAVAVEQSAHFEDIQIESVETGLPKYL